MSNEGSIIATHEIRLPEQFQGIFHDDVLTIKVGEYSEATRYRFNKLPEDVRDIFFVGVRSQFPEILDEKQYDEIDSYCKKLKIYWFASAWDVNSQIFLIIVVYLICPRQSISILLKFSSGNS